MENYLEKLVTKKSNEDNSICLNAYAKGIEDSLANEMLEMLNTLKEAMGELICLQEGWEDDYVNLDILIKKATTI